jgi:hypothetical protein
LTAEYLPASHSSHSVLTPATALCFPAAQLSHAVLTPAAALCCPALQLVQTVAALPPAYVPAPQSAQVEATVAPTAAENVPAAQLMHGPLPEVALKEPTHGVQSLPFWPVKPGRHSQSLMASLPICALAFWGHRRHVRSLKFMYRSTGQAHGLFRSPASTVPIVLARPSCPSPFAPQHVSSSPCRIAHICAPPAATAVAFAPGANDTRSSKENLFLLVLSLRPSCPKSFRPTQCIC